MRLVVLLLPAHLAAVSLIDAAASDAQENVIEGQRLLSSYVWSAWDSKQREHQLQQRDQGLQQTAEVLLGEKQPLVRLRPSCRASEFRSFTPSRLTFTLFCFSPARGEEGAAAAAAAHADIRRSGGDPAAHSHALKGRIGKVCVVLRCLL